MIKLTERAKIVEWALSQVGSHEDPLGSNKQKYGKMLDSTNWYLYKQGDKTWIHKVNGFDWCTQFVDSAFISVFTIDKARKMLFRPYYNNYGAVVKYAFNYFDNKGHGYKKEKYNPQPGDVIYFQNSKGLSHTGIIVEVTDTTVTTVEGNTGTGSNYVCKKSYSKKDSYIYGYGVPDYSELPVPAKYYPGESYKIVCSEYLNLRTGPGTNYEKAGRIEPGQVVICEGCITSGSYTWLRINNFYICAEENGQIYIK